jgi:hypothetical protein
MRGAVATLAVLLLATPALAQEFTEDQKALIVATIAANGCSIDEDGAERLMPPLGIEKDVFAAVTSHLEEVGQATWSDATETMTLAPELCP